MARTRRDKRSRWRRRSRRFEALEPRMVLDGSITFSELMYHPLPDDSDREWVELHNQNSVNVDLSNWRIEGGIEFDFPEGTVLEAGGYLVVARSPDTLQAAGIDGAAGPYSGQLNNAGDSLVLMTNSGRIVDQLEYGDRDRWPVGADGGGASLAKTVPGSASDDPGSWRAGELVGGTPGQVNFSDEVRLGENRALLQFDSPWRYSDAGQDLGMDWRSPAYDDSNWETGEGLFYAEDAPLPGPKNTPIRADVNTVYYRAAFDYQGDPALSFLSIDHVVDDGAVFYLNGEEVYRYRMPAGEVDFDTSALQVADATEVGPVSLPTSALVQGTNVLAVEVHQATALGNWQLVNVGAHVNGPVPDNLATETGATAFAQEVIFGGADANHQIANLNDGNYGNPHSWIGSNNASLTTFAGVALAGPRDVGRIAFGRSNVTSGDTRCGGVCIDRNLGTYTIQYTTVPNPGASTPSGSWTTINQVTYTGATPTPHLRHEYEFPQVEGVTGVRILLSDSRIAIDEIEVYAHDAPDAVFGAALRVADVIPPPAALRINEMDGRPGETFFVELINRDDRDLDLSGYVLVSSSGDSYDLPFSVLSPGEAIHFDQMMLGFRPDDNDRVYLYDSSRQVLLDAIDVRPQLRGRRADVDDRWQYPSDATPSAENLFDVPASVVVNEIMYHPPLLPATEGEFIVTGIVGADETWRYEDSDAYPGDGWNDLDFDDSAWSTGVAMLGVNAEGLAQPQRTVLNPDASTYYFRHSFLYDGAVGANVSLRIEALIDDGAVFYLNGQEIDRFNMPPGSIGHDTEASSSIIAASPQPSLLLPGGALVAGANVLAVEVHQAGDVEQAPGPQINASPGFEIGFDGNEGEYFNPAGSPPVPDNLALASRGVVPFGTGALVLPHTVPAINDGIYGNSNSWISAPNGNPYIGLSFPSPVEMRTIAWGRDNGNNVSDACGGQCTDRSIGTYTLQYTNVASPGTGTPETGDASTGWRTIGAITYSGSGFTEYLRHSYTVSREGEPIEASGLRIKVSDDGIAIDEIEVYDRLIGGLVNDVAMSAALSAVQTIAPPLPARENPAEWFELHNPTDQPVDLTGWSIDGGVQFQVPPGTTIDAGSYLVIADDAEHVRSLHPGATVIGDYQGMLSNGSETIEVIDARGNLVDTVSYFDRGRWPTAADGGGASLELLDPAADNDSAEVWAASRESGPWIEYSFRDVLRPDGGTEQYREFIFGLLDSGEVLLDDVSVVEDPDGTARQILRNGTFEADTLGQPAASWRLNGNHSGVVRTDPDDPSNKVLYMLATGPAEDRYNHAETTFVSNLPAQNGQVYEVSFRAKWLSGSNLLHSRFYFNRMPRTTALDTPAAGGTPGAANSTVRNVGPTFDGLSHSPTLPAVGQPITIQVDAIDPDQVNDVVLYYSVDGGVWSTRLMTSTQDSTYSAEIPGQPTGATIQFYIRARDGMGSSSAFPAAGPDSRALIRVQDGRASDDARHTFRIIMTAADAARLHDPIYRMSNGLSGATVVYDETEVFYDVGIRLRGSNAGRSDNNHVSFKVEFDPMHPFRGVEDDVTLDRSGRGSTAPLSQDEIVVKHIAHHAGGIPATTDDLVHLLAPNPIHDRTAALILDAYGNDYLDAQFDDGSEGTLFKLELAYVPSGTVGGNPENPKLPTPYFHPPSKDLQDLGEDKEAYRQHILIRNNRDRDDYSRIVELSRALSNHSGQALQQRLDQLIDVDQWARTFALQSLTGIADAYTRGGLNHNIEFYVRPSDNRVLAFMWDWDFAFTLSTGSSLIGTSSNTAKIFDIPANRRLFHGHLYDLIQTTFNAGYLSDWIEHYGDVARQNFSAINNYVQARSSFVLNGLPDAIPFHVTTNGGSDFEVDTPTAEIRGEGWVNVREIRLQGAAAPLDIRWIDDRTWLAVLPLTEGANTLTLEAYDHQGSLQGTDTITITSTVPTGDPAESLRITELMYHPPDPTDEEITAGFDDANEFEFIEIKNVGSRTVNLAGVRLSEGIDFTFGDMMLEPDGFVLVVEDVEAFQARYPQPLLVAGQWSGMLSNGGETIGLLDPLGVEIHRFTYGDTGSWPERADGHGSSLEVVDVEGPYDDSSNWRSSGEFYGSPGADGRGYVGDVVVNEVLSHTDPPTVDTIELLNRTDQPIDVGGWYLSDTRDSYRKYRLPDGTVIGAGEYLLVDETDFNAGMGTDPNDFALDGARGDDVWLLEADPAGRWIRFVDHVEFVAAANGETFGRWPDGVGPLYPAATPTLGAENGGPRVGPVVITELMVDPLDPDGPGPIESTDLEFVEIFNPTATGVDLTHWRLTDGVDFEFPAGYQLGPSSALVVVSFDPTDAANETLLGAFRAHYGIDENVPLVGGFGGQLENRGERVRLRRPDEPPIGEPTFHPLLLEDEVNYETVSPWPDDLLDSGMSLTRLAVARWGNDPTNWQGREPTPGALDALPPRVVQWSVNEDQEDPEDLPSGRQLSSWASQRSSIRSLQVTFDRPMVLDVDDIVLIDLGVNAPADPDTVVPLVSEQLLVEDNVLTIRFDAGGLEDGVYRLRILPSATDQSGNALDGDQDGVAGGEFVVQGDVTNKLYQLTGDWNGDYGLSIFDFSVFAYWFGYSVPRAPKYVDLSDDDGISIFDFQFFAANFGRGVTVPGTLAPAASPAAFAAGGETSIERGAARTGGVKPARARLPEQSAGSVRSIALTQLLAEWGRDDRSGESWDVFSKE